MSTSWKKLTFFQLFSHENFLRCSIKHQTLRHHCMVMLYIALPQSL